MSEKKLTPEMLLRDLDIPYLDLVLEEIFFMPGPSLRRALKDSWVAPETIQDLIDQCHFGVEDVLRRLRDIKRLSHGVEISSQEFLQTSLSKENVILLDVRLRSEFEKGHLEGAICFADLHFDEFLEDVRKKKIPIVTVGGSAEKNFSAAMFLKQNGVMRVHSLK